jgi:hypothetical protein
MIAAIADAPFLVYTQDAPSGLAGTIGVQVLDAHDNVVIARTTTDITELTPGSGIYQWSCGAAPATPGPYVVVWDTGQLPAQFRSELLQVTPGCAYVPPGNLSAVADLTDLAVLVPWARRACEGPYGPPTGRPELADDVLYPMVADACSEIILYSGSLFGHQLNVTARDPIAGYPTQWCTDQVLDQWESAVVICQLALDYWRFLYRDVKTSLSIANEGTEYSYTLSATVIGGYLKQLASDRDKAIAGLRAHNIVLDRYASNIRVRDQATVAMLEWWSTNTFDSAGGIPGGQEAYVLPAIGLPWSSGWSGGW